MSFDKIKSLWRSSSDSKQQSILDMTQNFISNSFRRSTLPPPSTTIQFDDYLASIPSLKKLKKKPKQSSSSSLKPQLLKKCFQSVDACYFNEKYQIDQLVFEKKAKVNMDRQAKLQEQLDQVEVCLFNQMSSRFDQILSVLRTIQTMDLLVEDSRRKIGVIRQDNLEKVMKVSEKQIKLAQLIARKKRLDSTLQLVSKLKQYKKFLQLSQTLQSSQNLQQFYTTVPQIKTNLQIFTKLKSSRTAPHKLEQAESALKRSFSDKINEKIFDYIKKDIPYQLEFWKKYVNSNKILEEKDQDEDNRDSTALLDQSTIIGGDQEVLVVIPKKDQNLEMGIVEYIRKGWQDGEYSVGKLKSDIDTFLKSKHNSFMLDFRNFCDQICKKHERNVQNPSLTNLLKQISTQFCVKVYTYFFDIHKSLLLKHFSSTRKILQFLTTLTTTTIQPLTIDQKQKLKSLAEGCAQSGAYLVRLVLEKLVDIIDTKIIHEGIDIGEIKQIVGVMENAELFLEKLVDGVCEVGRGYRDGLFLEFFQGLAARYPVKLLEVAKKRKLMDYLNKMHKNALTVQLKQSLQNETWQPTDIPIFYYDSLHYLITGESLNLRRNKHNLKSTQGTSTMMYETSVLMDGREQSFFQEPAKLVGNFRIIRNDIIINGHTYKVTQTLLLVLEMLEDYMTLAQNFGMIKGEVGVRINQIIRSYNVSSCQLIVHAGAVALQKIKNKNITSRHLALSSLCLSFILYIMQCLQKRVQIMDYQKLKQSLQQHSQIIIKKLNQILLYKANSCKPDINLKNTPSKGTEAIVSNTKILLEILSDYYGREILSKIFTKDVLNVYVEAIGALRVGSRVEAEALKDDVAFFFGELKGLEDLGNDFGERRIKAEDIVRKGFQEL